jgi:hypothetical protein
MVQIKLSDGKISREKFWSVVPNPDNIQKKPISAVKVAKMKTAKASKALYDSGTIVGIVDKDGNHVPTFQWPVPSVLPYYSKKEAVAILSKYKKPGIAMDQMVLQELVPCAKGTLSKLLQLKKEGKEIPDTEWRRGPALPPKKSIDLPQPANPPFYSKQETVDILSQYKTHASVIDEMIAQKLVVASKTKIYALLQLKAEGKEIPNTPWSKASQAKDDAAGKAREKPVIELPLPVNPPYYTKPEAIAILSAVKKHAPVMNAMLERNLVPSSKSSLYTLLKLKEEGKEVPDTPWNIRTPKKRKMFDDDVFDQSSKKQKAAPTPFQTVAATLNDTEFLRQVSLEFKRRGMSHAVASMKLVSLEETVASGEVSEVAVQKKTPVKSGGAVDLKWSTMFAELKAYKEAHGE